MKKATSRKIKGSKAISCLIFNVIIGKFIFFFVIIDQLMNDHSSIDEWSCWMQSSCQALNCFSLVKKHDGHFLCQNHERVFVFGSSFLGLRFRVFVFGSSFSSLRFRVFVLRSLLWVFIYGYRLRVFIYGYRLRVFVYRSSFSGLKALFAGGLRFGYKCLLPVELNICTWMKT